MMVKMYVSPAAHVLHMPPEILWHILISTFEIELVICNIQKKTDVVISDNIERKLQEIPIQETERNFNRSGCVTL